MKIIEQDLRPSIRYPENSGLTIKLSTPNGNGDILPFVLPYSKTGYRKIIILLEENED